MPNTLEYLYCSGNMIKKIDNVSKELKTFYCDYNMIESISEIPESLKKLNCSYNELNEIPKLTRNIIDFECFQNNLPYNNLETYMKYKIKLAYYKIKFGKRIENNFIKYVSNKKQYINNEITHRPNFGVEYFKLLEEANELYE
jgi:Leucine-rich repeat (LRR) protein